MRNPESKASNSSFEKRESTSLLGSSTRLVESQRDFCRWASGLFLGKAFGKVSGTKLFSGGFVSNASKA